MWAIHVHWICKSAAIAEKPRDAACYLESRPNERESKQQYCRLLSALRDKSVSVTLAPFVDDRKQTHVGYSRDIDEHRRRLY